jgi:hypothetical protein
MSNVFRTGNYRSSKSRLQIKRTALKEDKQTDQAGEGARKHAVQD